MSAQLKKALFFGDLISISYQDWQSAILHSALFTKGIKYSWPHGSVHHLPKYKYTEIFITDWDFKDVGQVYHTKTFTKNTKIPFPREPSKTSVWPSILVSRFHILHPF